MVQLEGFVQQGQENLVCKLKNTLYGLKQSQRTSYKNIDMFLVQNGFFRSIADHRLYFIKDNEHEVIVMRYVDGLIILVSLMSLMKALKSMLKKGMR